MKKSWVKLHVFRKIVVPLQRFNKQLIVLHVLKAEKNEKVSIFVRSCCSCIFRFLRPED